MAAPKLSRAYPLSIQHLCLAESGSAKLIECVYLPLDRFCVAFRAHSALAAQRDRWFATVIQADVRAHFVTLSCLCGFIVLFLVFQRISCLRLLKMMITLSYHHSLLSSRFYSSVPALAQTQHMWQANFLEYMYLQHDTYISHPCCFASPSLVAQRYRIDLQSSPRMFVPIWSLSRACLHQLRYLSLPRETV